MEKFYWRKGEIFESTMNKILILVILMLIQGNVFGKYDSNTEVLRPHFDILFDRENFIIDNSAASWSHTIAIKIPRISQLIPRELKCFSPNEKGDLLNRVRTFNASRNVNKQSPHDSNENVLRGADNKKPRNATCEIVSTLCTQIKPILDMYHNIAMSYRSEIEEQEDILNALLPPATKGNNKRSPFNLVSYVSKSLFGIARDSDVKAIQSHIQKLGSELYQDILLFNDNFESTKHVISDRIDNINKKVQANHDILNQTMIELNKVIMEENEYLQSIENYVKVTKKQVFDSLTLLHSISINEVEALQMLLLELQDKVKAVQSLLVGQLTVYLIRLPK